MKKFLCVLTVLCLLFSLAACGGSDSSDADGAESTESESSEEEQESEEVSEEESEEDLAEEQTESSSETETEIVSESETETGETETVKTGTSVTEETFELITSLTRSDLSYNAAHDYNYEGFQFTDDISERLAKGDKTTSVPPRAFYVKIAEVIEEYLESGKFSSSYVAYIFGYEVSEEEFAAKVEDLSAYIVSSNALKPIVTKLESISNVTVTDTDSGYTVIEIEDVEDCAAEMGISEVMLGYIFGALKDCGVSSFEFDGYACTLTCLTSYLTRS